MMFFSWFMLVLLFGLRYRVGGDSMNYIIRYETFPAVSELFAGGLEFGRFQPLWQLLFASVRHISSDFVVFQIIHAIIVNTIIFKFINQNTRYFFTGILVYFICYSFYFNMEVLRESLAISIFLLSLKPFSQKRWFKYYIIVTISFLFHFSAIILFILPLFREFQINYRNVLLLFSYFILGILFSRLARLILSSMEVISSLSSVIEPYLHYTFTIWGMLYVVIAYIVFPILIYILAKNYFHISIPYYQFLAFYVLVGASISYFVIFERFLNYFTPILCLYITEVLHALFREKGRLRLRISATAISFTLICTLFVHAYFSDTSDIAPNTRWYYHWYPYSSIIDKRISEDRERLIEAEGLFKILDSREEDQNE